MTLSRLLLDPTPPRNAFLLPPAAASASIPDGGGHAIWGYVSGPLPDVDLSLADRELTTTAGTVAVAPLDLLPTGSFPDPGLTVESAAEYYSQVGVTCGWVAVGQNDTGVWVSGVFTGTAEQLEHVHAVRGDIRVNADGRPVLVGVWAPVPPHVLPERAYGLTKGDILRMLTEGDLAGLPDSTPLIMRKDAEGNGHSPLYSAHLGMYFPYSCWSGEVSPTPELIAADPSYTDEDQAPEGSVRAIVLDPTN